MCGSSASKGGVYIGKNGGYTAKKNVHGKFVYMAIKKSYYYTGPGTTLFRVHITISRLSGLLPCEKVECYEGIVVTVTKKAWLCQGSKLLGHKHVYKLRRKVCQMKLLIIRRNIYQKRAIRSCTFSSPR